MLTKNLFFSLMMVLTAPSFLFAQNQQIDQKARSSENTYTISGAAEPSPGSENLGVAGILKYRSDLGTKGSMFLNEDWKEGILVLNDGSEVIGWSFRYDIYHQQMQYADGNDTLALANPMEIQSLEFDGKTFTVEPCKHQHGMDTFYVEVIREGDVKLLLHHRITHHVVDQRNDDPMDDTYIHNDVYYLKFPEKEAVPLVMNKKCIYKLFEDQKEEIKTFIRENNLRCKNEADIIAVLDFYESIR